LSGVQVGRSFLLWTAVVSSIKESPDDMGSAFTELELEVAPCEPPCEWPPLESAVDPLERSSTGEPSDAGLSDPQDAKKKAISTIGHIVFIIRNNSNFFRNLGYM